MNKPGLIIGAIIVGLCLLLAGSVVYLLNLESGDKPESKDPNPEIVQLSPPKEIPSSGEDDPSRTKQPVEKKDFIEPLGLDQAEFMGTRASGKRFCIIADASNSMMGKPLLQVKKEILQTLGSLRPSSRFYIIFFHARDVPMPFPSWLSADKENVDKVRPWIQGMSTVLRTLPLSAFERALKLEPRPDVIFYMTDGLLMPKNVPELVARLNEKPRVVIHTIMFSKQKAPGKKNVAAAQLRLIAEKSKGTFRHVENSP